MKRRILAWIILAAFILLLLNLFVFRVYWQLSLAVYLIIVIAFVLTSGKLVKAIDVYNNDDDNDNLENDDADLNSDNNTENDNADEDADDAEK